MPVFFVFYFLFTVASTHLISTRRKLSLELNSNADRDLPTQAWLIHTIGNELRSSTYYPLMVTVPASYHHKWATEPTFSLAGVEHWIDRMEVLEVQFTTADNELCLSTLLPACFLGSGKVAMAKASPGDSFELWSGPHTNPREWIWSGLFAWNCITLGIPSADRVERLTWEHTKVWPDRWELTWKQSRRRGSTLREKVH